MSYDRAMRKKHLFLLLLPLLLGACMTTSPPASFYVLSPMAPSREVHLPDMLVGVGPVNLADYLDRNQLVSRSSEVGLKLDEFNRWAGGLDRNITQVLAENLSRLLNMDGVLAYPWSASIDLDYQFVLDISRFDSDPGNRVILDVQWQLFDQRQRKLVDVQRGHFEVLASGNNQEALVQARSQALAELSESLAQAVHAAAGNE
ncbi:PqiC family protein [Thiolapillus sp.]